MGNPLSMDLQSRPENKPAREFARAVLRYVLKGNLRAPDGHVPPSGHDIPRNFSGVCVAAAEDPAGDDYVISQLHALGVKRVRLDFSYGDITQPAGRLLEALLAQPFEVLLHLIQPFDAAKKMPAEEACREWGNFVSDTLQRYGDKIWAVEIGSTINRKRWAGYTLAGFLSAWEIAYAEARRRNVKLAGPNITDFEPVYNIGMLSILQNRGQLPDIHTNNLFSERSTEPERYDHKIIGRKHAGRLRVNLVKKAYLLNKIGADHGVPELQSPAAFWTLPRIERLLEHGEQKQADYLARYMLLCAASGALGNASWGPLICHREGLIDDGHMPYPKLERITHYAGADGNINEYFPRPAFHAFSTFNRLIPGMHYEGPLNTTEGLEVHSFASATQRIHAVWTINSRAAALVDIYDENDLLAATFLDRDGVGLANLPDLASESPIYLCWSASRPIAVKAEAGILDNLALHRHMEGMSHFLFRKHGWQGLVTAKDAHDAEQLISMLHPEHMGTPPREALLRKARNAIWTIPDTRGPGSKLVIKQPLKMHLHKRFFDRFKPSKGKRSWNGTNQLLRRGIEAARPVAYFEKIGDTSLTQNYYICEFVQTDFTARQLLSAYAEGKSEFMGISEEDAYRQLSQFLLKMHGRGVFFRDLSGGNILIRKHPDGILEFSLIDTNRARFFDHPATFRMRISDLTRVCNKLHWDGRKRFMAMYLRPLKRDFDFFTRLPFYLYDFKVNFKRRVGRKAIRNLLRRARGSHKPAS